MNHKTSTTQRIGDVLRARSGAALDEIDNAIAAVEEHRFITGIPNARVTQAEGKLRAARILVAQAVEDIGEAPE